MIELSASWESRLEAEGLGVVRGKFASRSLLTEAGIAAAQANVAAVERWQTWARRVLREHLWWNDHEREIWRLYSEGVPTREIPARVASTASRAQRRDPVSHRFASDGRPSSRYAIQRIIARVKREHPGPESPWRHRALSVAPAAPPPAVSTLRRFSAAECRALERELKPARKDRK